MMSARKRVQGGSPYGSVPEQPLYVRCRKLQAEKSEAEEKIVRLKNVNDALEIELERLKGDLQELTDVNEDRNRHIRANKHHIEYLSGVLVSKDEKTLGMNTEWLCQFHVAERETCQSNIDILTTQAEMKLLRRAHIADQADWLVEQDSLQKSLVAAENLTKKYEQTLRSCVQVTCSPTDPPTDWRTEIDHLPELIRKQQEEKDQLKKANADLESRVEELQAPPQVGSPETETKSKPPTSGAANEETGGKKEEPSSSETPVGVNKKKKTTTTTTRKRSARNASAATTETADTLVETGKSKPDQETCTASARKPAMQKLQESPRSSTSTTKKDDKSSSSKKGSNNATTPAKKSNILKSLSPGHRFHGPNGILEDDDENSDKRVTRSSKVATRKTKRNIANESLFDFAAKAPVAKKKAKRRR